MMPHLERHSFEAAAREERTVVAFLFLQAEAPGNDFEMRLPELPDVEEVHRVAGEDCYVVKVRVSDVADLDTLLRESFYTLESLRSIRTTLVLKTVKEAGVC